MNTHDFAVCQLTSLVSSSLVTRPSSLDLDPRLLHQLRVARVFGAEHLAERLGRRVRAPSVPN
jgi:hypothetical protein